MKDKTLTRFGVAAPFAACAIAAAFVVAATVAAAAKGGSDVAGQATDDAVPTDRQARFGQPVMLTAGGEPINVQIGHAHPLVMDWNGNGKLDLLVGQFGQGKLRLYRNVGTNDKPRFDGYTYVQAGGADAATQAG